MSSQKILEKIKENIDSYEEYMQLRRELFLQYQDLTRSIEESEKNPDTSNIELAMKVISSNVLTSSIDRHLHYIDSEIAQILHETSYFIELLKSKNNNEI